MVRDAAEAPVNEKPTLPFAVPRWLANSSFPSQAFSVVQDLISDSESDNEVVEAAMVQGFIAAPEKDKKRKKHKKHKKYKDNYSRKRRSDRSPEISAEEKAKKRDRERAEQLIKQGGSRVFIGELGLEPEQAFRVDKQKDEYNLIYGELYKMHVARYRLHGRRCLGSNEPLKKKFSARNMRYFARENRVAACREAEAVQKLPEIGSDWSFIPLPTTEAHTPENTEENATQDASWTKKQYEDFNRRLREDPHNVDLWLEFVKFQNEFVSNTANPERQNIRLSQALYEIKSSVLKKALEKNPSSTRLKLIQLEVCRDQWEADKTTNSWKEFVFKNPSNPVIWLHYLQFVQSKFTSFTVNGTLKIYVKCLQTLRSLQEGQLKSHTAHPHTTEYMIAIFARMCRFLYQAGLAERAIAFYQLLLEFNLFQPTVLSKACLEDKLEILEAYWESPSPHLGEDGCVGWRQWTDSKGYVEPIVPWGSKEEDENVEEKLIKNFHGSKTTTWVAMEISRASRHWLPWRGDIRLGESEEDCEDPDRLVLFDDLSASVFSLKTDQQRFMLLCHFLRLLQVDVPCAMSSRDTLCQQFELAGQGSDVPYGLYPDEDVALLRGFMHNDHAHHDTFVANLITQSLSAFSGRLKTLLCLVLFRHRVQAVLKLKASVSRKEFKAKCKDCSRIFKTVLREETNRNNLLLWDFYAHFEWKHGSQEGARKVFEMALADASPSQSDAQRLHRTFIQCELGMSDNMTSMGFQKELSPEAKDGALHLIVCANSVMPFVPYSAKKSYNSPVNLLKARKHFEEVLPLLLDRLYGELSLTDLQVLSYVGNSLVHHVHNQMLLLYLTRDLDSALELHSSVVKQIPVCRHSTEAPKWEAAAFYADKVLELLEEIRVNLIVFHLNVTVTSRSLLHTSLCAVLDRFPDNAHFWRLLLDIENKVGAISKLRAIVHRHAKDDAGLVVWLYAALAEFRRMHRLQAAKETSFVMESGVTNQLRSWFERALSAPQGERSPLLWRLYLHLEISLGNAQKAKGVFYRAVQVCPWSKWLFLDFVHSGLGDLQEITDLMTEKEFRLRAPLEELQLLIAVAAGEKAEESVEVKTENTEEVESIVENVEMKEVNDVESIGENVDVNS